MITRDIDEFVIRGRFDQIIHPIPLLPLIAWTSVRQKANLCYIVGKSSRLLFSVLMNLRHRHLLIGINRSLISRKYT